MRADYPGALVVEAANYGYAAFNHPKGFCFHTPEEIADDDPQTPDYLAGTTRLASYHYFVSYLGFVFQLVPEYEGAYANYVTGKPYPSWADSTVNLNLQTISVSFEGMAATIHQTMPRGGPQWKAGVELVRHRSKALGISEWTRHMDVSDQRGDTGQLNVAAFMADVEDNMDEREVRNIVTEMLRDDVSGGLRKLLRSPDTVEHLQADISGASVRGGEVAKVVNGAISGHNDNIPHGGSGGTVTIPEGRGTVVIPEQVIEVQ